MSSDNDKLETLASIEGFADVEEMIESVALDSVLPGICTNDGCDYTTDVEPDQAHGWCASCDTTTVASVLMLGGMI